MKKISHGEIERLVNENALLKANLEFYGKRVKSWIELDAIKLELYAIDALKVNPTGD